MQKDKTSQWAQTSLDELIDIKHGWAFPGAGITETPSNNVLVTPGNFKIGGGFKDSNKKFFEGDYPEEYLLLPGDLIVTMTDLSKGADTLGYSALVPRDGRNYLHNQRIGLVKIKSDRIRKDFLYWLMRTYQYQRFIAGSASGTTEKHTSPSSIKKYSFLLPPKEEQEEIARILSSLDDKIELNNQINRNLEEQAKAIFKSWFVDFEPFRDSELVDSELGRIPKGWKIGTLGDIIELHDHKRIPLSSRQRENMEKKYPYYGAASLMDYVDNYLFDGVYTLLGEDGTVVTDDGMPVLQYVWGRFWVNNHAHILTGKNGYSAETLYVLLMNTPVKSIVTGAVQPKISQANLKSIPIIIAPQDIIRKYGALIEPFFEEIRRNSDESSHLVSIRDALLPKLMSGEIDVFAIKN